MAKVKGIASSTKAKILNDIRKRSLKVVLHKIKYPLHSQTKKSNLIETLLFKERKTLKLGQETSCVLFSEPKENIVQDKILKFLDEEKKRVFARGNDSDSSDLDNSVPAKVLQTTNEWKMQKKVAFAAIPKSKIDKFFSELNMEPKTSDYNTKLNQCLSRFHSSCKPPWNSPSCIMKAMNDCILHRKWNNLTHLLLMMIRLPTPRYRPLIRHMCEIMDKLHPVIQNNGLQNQFRIINQINRINR